MSKVKNMVKKTALAIAFSCLLLMAFIAISANAESTSGHPPTSKNMVYYPQGKVNMPLCFSTHHHLVYCTQSNHVYYKRGCFQDLNM